MEDEYIISNEALIKRIERDFFIQPERIPKRIIFYNGALPSEIENLGGIFLGKIQFKESVFLKGRELLVSSHSGESRINHFRTLIDRYSQITQRKIELQVQDYGNFEKLANDWVDRIGDIPQRLIIGSSMGISSFLRDIKLKGEEKNFWEFVETTISTYTTQEYLSASFGNIDRKEVAENLRKDEYFLRDCRLMWMLTNFGPRDVVDGFQGKFCLDEYLDYTKQVINGREYLNIHYPYGDQIRFIARALLKRTEIQEVYYIGSCGMLREEGRINHLVVPTEVKYRNEKIKFNNLLAEERLFKKNIDYFVLPVKTFFGSLVSVDSPHEETIRQLQTLRDEGFVAVDTDIFHIIKAFNGSKLGIVCYVSDKPLSGHTLDKMPESYIGWRVGVKTLLDNLNLKLPAL